MLLKRWGKPEEMLIQRAHSSEDDPGKEKNLRAFLDSRASFVVRAGAIGTVASSLDEGLPVGLLPCAEVPAARL